MCCFIPQYFMAMYIFVFSLPLAMFLLESSWAIYVAAVISGVSTGTFWPAQGHYLIQNSTPENISRNASIFWVIYMLS